MAATKSTNPAKSTNSFDVTCVVGTVELTEYDGISAYLAAFHIIAEHEAQGTYHFPLADGRDCSVTVKYEG